MKEKHSLRTLVHAKAADYLGLYRQKHFFTAEIADINLRRMPILLLYFTIAFITNLIFNAWLGDSPIAPHDWAFSAVTLLFWILYFCCAFGRIQSNSVKRMIYGGFWISSNIYLLIFIGMDILLSNNVYNYLLGMFILAILPLLSPLQSAITVLINMTFAILLSSYAGNDETLVQFIIGSSAFAVIISAKEYFSYLRIQSVHKRLSDLSERDRLTGLYNRNALDSHVAKLWADCFANHSTLTIAMIDIDYFKNFNDTFGHILGDRCLEKVTDCIVKAASPQLLMRYGGEEFLIFFAAEEAPRIIEVLKDVQSRIEGLDLQSGTGSTYSRLTVSIGVSRTKPESKSSVDTLINEADKQLYQAKKSGRNCICGI